MTEDLARMMRSTDENGPKDFLTDDPSWAIDFAPNGTLLNVGDIITRKRYANTLEAIAERGGDAFYTGAIAESIVRAVQAANGTMTLDDLREYRIAIRDTAQIDYRGFKITSTTAPSSGVIGLSILKIVEGYGDFFAPDNVGLSTHRLNEAMRFAYGQVRTVWTAYSDWRLSFAENEAGRSRVCGRTV